MKIITLPNPILKKKSTPVDKVNNEIKKLMDGMLSTMYKAPGIGLAAPQVGINKRIIVMDVSPRPGLKRYQEEKNAKKQKGSKAKRSLPFWLKEQVNQSERKKQSESWVVKFTFLFSRYSPPLLLFLADVAASEVGHFHFHFHFHFYFNFLFISRKMCLVYYKENA